MINPLVSIYMITYNHEPYIAQAIESVLMQQTDFKYMLVIGEDCSTDNTGNICEEYSKQYPEKILLLPTDKNLGSRENALKTFTACKGKYIAMCEGDDYWTDPFKLQKQFDFMEANPDYGLVHTDVDELFVKKETMANSINKAGGHNFNSGNVFEQVLTYSYTIQTCTVLFRTDLINKHFNASDPMWQFAAGDIALWLELSRHSLVKYMGETMAVKRHTRERPFHVIDPRKRYEFYKSTASCRQHFINKYGCSEVTRRKFILNSNKQFQHLGYILIDKKISTDVFNNLKEINSVTFFDYLYYYYSINIVIRWLVNFYIGIKKVFKNISNFNN